MVEYEILDYFDIFEEAEDKYIYYSKKKMKNNQTAYFFLTSYYNDKRYDFAISFAVANKRKDIKNWMCDKQNNIKLKSSGSCGLEALIWAKNQLILLEKCCHPTDKISVYGEDSRRGRVYKAYLDRLGYKYDGAYNEMFKIIQ